MNKWIKKLRISLLSQVTRHRHWSGRMGLKPHFACLLHGWSCTETFRASVLLWNGDFCLLTQSCPTLCDPRDCSTPGFPVLHCLMQFARTHVHWVDDAIQPSHPLPSPSPAFNISQHQGLFQWVGSSLHVTKVLELQLHQQPFQWIFRVDFL